MISQQVSIRGSQLTATVTQALTLHDLWCARVDYR
jgi:hypothetical protein